MFFLLVLPVLSVSVEVVRYKVPVRLVHKLLTVEAAGWAVEPLVQVFEEYVVGWIGMVCWDFSV